MLPIYILSKNNIRFSNAPLFQWLNITVRLCSSSDSSDSDSDNEKAKRKRTHVKSAAPTTPDADLGSFLNNIIEGSASSKVAKQNRNTYTKKVVKEQETAKTEDTHIENNDLMTYLNNMLKERKLQTKSIDVAMQPRKKKLDLSSKQKSVSYEQELIGAAEDVAITLGGDKAKTTSDLLQRALLRKEELINENKRRTNVDNTKVDQSFNSLTFSSRTQESASSTQITESKEGESFTNKKRTARKSIIQSLLDDHKEHQINENSISRQLLKNNKASAQKLQQDNRVEDARKFHARQEIDIWNGVPHSVFENMGVISPNIPELKTWAALEQKELKAHATYPPANIFQELILWTEQGKIWKFPIDNEQGLEEEQNVHFSEHVFMERHLKEWCPKSGPIRHFMELVCTGLSKNPYLTVQEKINHIMWFKEYFQSKETMLKELGAIEEAFPGKTREITE